MNVSELFGSKVFDDRVMEARRSADVYASLKQTINQGIKLDANAAGAVASAMKEWAVKTAPLTSPTGSSRSQA